MGIVIMSIRKQPKTWPCPKVDGRCHDPACKKGAECQQPGKSNVTNIRRPSKSVGKLDAYKPAFARRLMSKAKEAWGK